MSRTILSLTLLVSILALALTGFSGWTQIPGRLTMVSSGAAGVWGVNKAGYVYFRNDANAWTMPIYREELADISVGGNEVWGVNKNQDIYTKSGRGPWIRIAGRLIQVSVSPNDRVWGVNAAHNIYKYNRGGGDAPWTQVGGELKSVSVGQTGVWGVTEQHDIYYREGTYGDVDTLGTKWTPIKGLKLKWISVGNNLVVGVNSVNDIYYRVGITAGNPKGFKWVKIAGKLAQIDVNGGDIWGVTAGDKIYTAAAIAVSGKRDCADTSTECKAADCGTGRGKGWKIMAQTCAKTCGVCGCRDAMSGCPEWTGEGYCTKPSHKEYMLYYCPLSCKVCDILTTRD